jgi:hypothetical protein
VAARGSRLVVLVVGRAARHHVLGMELRPFHMLVSYVLALPIGALVTALLFGVYGAAPSPEVAFAIVTLIFAAPPAVVVFWILGRTGIIGRDDAPATCRALPVVRVVER